MSEGLPPALLPWIRAQPEPDAAVEALLGIQAVPPEAGRPSGELVGYLPSGAHAILDAFEQSGLSERHTFVDVGSGAGKVVLLAALLTGARAVGIEHQPDLVALARAQARRLNLDRVEFILGDARDGLPTGDVYFLYVPCSGGALDQVMAQLAPKPRPFVVCALGLSLERYDFLRPRPTDHFWLTLYDAASTP